MHMHGHAPSRSDTHVPHVLWRSYIYVRLSGADRSHPPQTSKETAPRGWNIVSVRISDDTVDNIFAHDAKDVNFEAFSRLKALQQALPHLIKSLAVLALAKANILFCVTAFGQEAQKPGGGVHIKESVSDLRGDRHVDTMEPSRQI